MHVAAWPCRWLWLGIALIAGGLPTCAAAQQVSTITIAAQPLDTALYELAVKANVNILFSPDLIGRLTTKGASGDVRDIPALAQRLLAGTGLVLERTRKGFIIKRGRDHRRKLPAPPHACRERSSPYRRPPMLQPTKY